MDCSDRKRGRMGGKRQRERERGKEVVSRGGEVIKKKRIREDAVKGT